MATMMMLSAFNVRTGIRSPPKAGSSASDVTNGFTIHVPVSTATTKRPSTSALYACLKVKVKLSRYTPWRQLGEEEVYLLLTLNLGTGLG
jgi:hypothetical protein